MNEITYTRQGDYLLPNLFLEEQLTRSDNPPALGMYGRMRRRYLKDHREIYYNSLLLTGRLYSHLLEIDQQASDLMGRMMQSLEQKNPPPDKATDPMGWTQHMNSLREQAEEHIRNDLIYS